MKLSAFLIPVFLLTSLPLQATDAFRSGPPPKGRHIPRVSKAMLQAKHC